jgi:VWFA-related protein
MTSRSLLLAFLLAQTPTFTEPPVFVTAIDLVTEVRDANGKMPMDLKPSDFIVLEDGKEMPVIGVEYLGLKAAAPAPSAGAAPEASVVAAPGPDWQTIIYFDLTLTSPEHRNWMVKSLMKQADELTRLGTVDIVVATPAPQAVLEASRDAEAVRQGLKKILKHGAMNAITAHRREYLRDRDIETDIALPGVRQALDLASVRVSSISHHVAQEIELSTRFQRNLFGWLSRYPRHEPRALVLISDGFELDPGPFYLRATRDAAVVMSVQSELAQRGVSAANARAGALLAAAGWMTVSIPGAMGGGGDWSDEAARSTGGRIREFTGENPTKVESAYLNKDASASLQQLADITGGAVLNSGQAVSAVSELAQRVKITYQVSRAPDGRPRSVQIRSTRPDLRVRTSRWASSTTPEVVAAERVMTLLRGEGDKGDLPVTARIDWRADSETKLNGTLFVESSVKELEPLLREGKPSFRITFGARTPSGQIFTVHRVTSAWDQKAMMFATQAPIVAERGRTRYAVTVEELTSGAWGATVVEAK